MSTRKSGKSQETAAACAAISERSGRRIEKGERQPIPGERHWRTRNNWGHVITGVIITGVRYKLFK